jgi:hypothetical protein
MGTPSNNDNPGEPLGDWRAVALKHDRFYKHNIMHVNYTTYDVRRGEDVIHAGSSHSDIMALNSAFTEDSSKHPFCYARVLGIFHANVVYLGEQNQDYRPRRLEFLWVRWYSVEEGVRSGWKTWKLDRIRFPPMVGNVDAFGFLDPADALRGCHTIPAFSGGRIHPDGKLFSNLSQDQNDWFSYYINRCVDAVRLFFLSALFSFVLSFVDRDMVIRYHWGHGVGHTYAFGGAMGADATQAPLPAEIEEQDNNVSRGLSGEVDDGLDDRSLGEDDMVYQNDSDGNMSEEDVDDEVCSQHDAFVTKSTYKGYSKHTSIQRYGGWMVMQYMKEHRYDYTGESTPPPSLPHNSHLLCLLRFSLRPLSNRSLSKLSKPLCSTRTRRRTHSLDDDPASSLTTTLRGHYYGSGDLHPCAFPAARSIYQLPGSAHPPPLVPDLSSDLKKATESLVLVLTPPMFLYHPIRTVSPFLKKNIHVIPLIARTLHRPRHIPCTFTAYQSTPKINNVFNCGFPPPPYLHIPPLPLPSSTSPSPLFIITITVAHQPPLSDFWHLDLHPQPAQNTHFPSSSHYTCLVLPWVPILCCVSLNIPIIYKC